MDENRKICPDELNSLLHMAISRYGLDIENTYVEFTWWNHVFKPLVQLDCDRSCDKSWSILVFGSENCNTFRKRSDGVVFPTGFWINKNAVYIDQVVHRPVTLKSLLDSPMLFEHDEVRFLFSSSPVNYYVGINPFKTVVYKNTAGESILAFYADDRDSGEMRSFSDLIPSDIKLVEA